MPASTTSTVHTTAVAPNSAPAARPAATSTTAPTDVDRASEALPTERHEHRERVDLRDEEDPHEKGEHPHQRLVDAHRAAREHAGDRCAEEREQQGRDDTADGGCAQGASVRGPARFRAARRHPALRRPAAARGRSRRRRTSPSGRAGGRPGRFGALWPRAAAPAPGRSPRRPGPPRARTGAPAGTRGSRRGDRRGIGTAVTAHRAQGAHDRQGRSSEERYGEGERTVPQPQRRRHADQGTAARGTSR